MILKLKEIHKYTHQLASSDSEDEAPSAGRTAHMKPPAAGSAATGSRPVSCAQTVNFKEPTAPATISPLKHREEMEVELLSASQGSNTSSTAASEESERYSVDHPRYYTTTSLSCRTLILFVYFAICISRGLKVFFSPTEIMFHACGSQRPCETTFQSSIEILSHKSTGCA